jgi:hypothetical protein
MLAAAVAIDKKLMLRDAGLGLSFSSSRKSSVPDAQGKKQS